MLSSLLITILSFIMPAHNHAAGRVGHPFHVSSTDVRFTPKKEIQITARLFLDDSESALAAHSRQRIDLIKPTEHSRMDALLKAYMAATFSLQINGKSVPLQYLGYEVDSEAIQVYIQGAYTQAPHTISLHNSIFYNIFTDQINIMHVYVGASRQSVKVLYPKADIAVKF